MWQQIHRKGQKKKQVEILTNFMCGHHDLARGILKSAQGRKNSGFLWERLSISLNTDGPPQKDVKDWKKTWSDLKYKVKTKLRNNKRHLKGTGGGPYMQKKIDDYEERILECAGLEAAVEGVPTAKLFGASNNNNRGVVNANSNNVEPSPMIIQECINMALQNEVDNDEDNRQEELLFGEIEGNPSASTRNVRVSKKENKENLKNQYVTATESINNKLSAIHELLCSTS